MQAIYSDVTISMSEFKKNPAAVLRKAKSKRVAVLSRNKAAFYMIEPAFFAAILEELADQDLHRSVLSRMSERANAIEVDPRDDSAVYPTATARIAEMVAEFGKPAQKRH